MLMSSHGLGEEARELLAEFRRSQGAVSFTRPTGTTAESRRRRREFAGSAAFLAWFWRIAEKTHARCGEGATRRGREMSYKTVLLEGRLFGMHRLVWEIAHGERVPKGMVVMHTCDTPPCCNPDHLILGTHAENMADCARKGRKLYEMCQRKLHRMEPGNLYITRSGVRRCRACRRAKDLAAPTVRGTRRTLDRLDRKIDALLARAVVVAAEMGVPVDYTRIASVSPSSQPSPR